MKSGRWWYTCVTARSARPPLPRGVRHVFVVRDPRDVAVDSLHVLREKDHYLHAVSPAQRP
jgi:hypothetical protein